MSTTYKEKLDSLSFSEEAKERLAGNLAAALEANENEIDAVRDIPRFTPIATAEAKSSKTRFFKKRWYLVAAASLAGALVVGSAGAIAATGNLTTVGGLIDDVFNGAPASTEIVNSIGRPIGASASCNGITVTADAVVGDRWNYVVVFSIARDDGQPFDMAPNTGAAAGTLPLMFDGPSALHVDWVDSTGGGIHFYDADPSDNAIQMAQSMSVSTLNGKGIIGNTARVHLKDLYAIDESGERRLLAPGTWDIKFAMNYDDTTIDLPAGYSTEFNGMKADIESIAISPIAVTVDYTAHGVMDWRENGNGQMDEHNANELERIANLPILVTLADGTTIDATESASSSSENGDGTTSVHKSYAFDVLADPNDITSVTVGGKEVWAEN